MADVLRLFDILNECVCNKDSSMILVPHLYATDNNTPVDSNNNPDYKKIIGGLINKLFNDYDVDSNGALSFSGGMKVKGGGGFYNLYLYPGNLNSYPHYGVGSWIKWSGNTSFQYYVFVIGEVNNKSHLTYTNLIDSTSGNIDLEDCTYDFLEYKKH